MGRFIAPHPIDLGNEYVAAGTQRRTILPYKGEEGASTARKFIHLRHSLQLQGPFQAHRHISKQLPLWTEPRSLHADISHRYVAALRLYISCQLWQPIAVAGS